MGMHKPAKIMEIEFLILSLLKSQTHRLRVFVFRLLSVMEISNKKTEKIATLHPHLINA